VLTESDIVAHLLTTSFPLGLNLQTHTLVTSVTASSGSPTQWDVHTARGIITTPTVVHASNAFAPTTLPFLEGCIKPKAFICNKFVPPPAFSGSKALQNTYGVLLPNDALFSINPRSNSDGVILFGGSNPNQGIMDKLLEEHPELAGDDRLGNYEPIAAAVKALTDANFEGWDNSNMKPGEGFDYNWSGVLGRVGVVHSCTTHTLPR
jgi:glycine/D-amino acid oxidase-like deaminating enzyme